MKSMASLKRFVEWGNQHGYDKERAVRRGEKLGFAIKTYLFILSKGRFVGIGEVADWLDDVRGFRVRCSAMRYTRRLLYALKESGLLETRHEGCKSGGMEVRAVKTNE